MIAGSGATVRVALLGMLWCATADAQSAQPDLDQLSIEIS